MKYYSTIDCSTKEKNIHRQTQNFRSPITIFSRLCLFYETKNKQTEATN